MIYTFFFLISIVTFVITFFILKKLSIIKTPSSRGLKEVKVINCGGVSVFINFTFFFIFLSIFENINYFNLFYLSFFILFLVGLIDDLKNLNFKWKLVFQFIAAIILFKYLAFDVANNKFFFNFLGIIIIVWFINFYNFMDGADGFISSVVIFSFFGLIILIIVFNIDFDHKLLIYPMLAILPFLCFNFNPSKIILGDCGSTLLGFYSVYIFFEFFIINMQYAVSFLILINSILIDSFFTLLVRLYKKKNIFSAHKTHMYQKMIMKKGYIYFYKFYIVLSLFWFFPLCYLTFKFNNLSFFLYFISIIPMIFFLKKYNVGSK